MANAHSLTDAVGYVIGRCDRSAGGCLLWTGGTTRGYASKDMRGKRYRAHVIVWMAANGPIPDGQVVDHTCHDPKVCAGGNSCPHRRCMELSHLKLVSNAENVLRGGGPTALNAQKTYCVRGHPYSGDNLVIKRSGSRGCKICRGFHKKTYEHRLRGGPARPYIRREDAPIPPTPLSED